jgi:hypothetical protein
MKRGGAAEVIVLIGYNGHMERLRIKIRKKLWVTLSAEPGHEKRAIAMLLFRLASDRQHVHIMNTLGNKPSAYGGGKEFRYDGKEKVCSLDLKWTGNLTNEQFLDIFDWLSPIVFQATRKGTLAGLRELLLEADRR